MLGTLIALGLAGAVGWAALSNKKSNKKNGALESKYKKVKKHEKRDFELTDNQAKALKKISDKKINIKKTRRTQKVEDSLTIKAKNATKKSGTKKISNELLDAESKIISIEDEYLKNIDERYISNSELQFLKKLIEKCSEEISKQLGSIKKEKHKIFFQILEGDFSRDDHNEKFLKKEAEIQGEYFKQFEEHGLTDKQLQAVLTDEDAVLVNAGAGTGKTKTIESKVLYLHNIKHVPLNEILVITFAKKSKKDMMKRIIEALNQSGVEVKKEDLEETISTFHAFGKRILDEYDEKNGIIYEPNKSIGRGRVGRKVITPEDEGNPLGGIILGIIEEMKTGPMKDELIQYLTYFSRPKLQVQDYDSRGSYYEDVKKTYISLLREPENGYSYHVKSYGELMIANYFAMHGIPALYEPNDYFYTNNKKHKKNYKPDFVIPEEKDEEGNIIREKIYIEYFGVDKDGKTAPYIDNNDYVQKMKEKIKQHKKSHNILIDLRYADFQEGYNTLLGKLENELKKYGVPIKELDYEEKFKVLGDEEGTFEQLLKTFLSLYKESDETIESLREKANIIDADNYERMQTFLNIFQVFLDKYNQELKKKAYMDFGDMIYEAKKILISGAVERKFKYILVDEFQDISEARAGLINTLIEDPYETKLFCVGDDWQSIYNFSGSNINIFLKFDSYFGYTKYITLDRTFRFNQGISDISGSFIMMNPEQNKKSLTALDPTTKGRFEIFQKVPAKEIGNDEEKLQSTHFVTYERILRSLLDDFINNFSKDNEKEFEDGFCKISILYLARYKFENLLKSGKSTFLTYLQNVYSIKEPEGDDDFFTVKLGYQGYKFDIKITPYTIHKSKGLQATYVLVDYVNQVERGYSFPSSMTDDPLLYLVINDDKKGYPNAEERRLFYVAITRGIKKVYLCYERNKESSFLRDLIKAGKQIKKSVINVTKDDQTGAAISLLEKYEAPKCKICGGRILPSIERSTDDPKIKSYYCSNLWMGCDASYYDFEGKRYLAPYCPNGCGERMVIRKSGNSTDYFRGCKNFTLTRCSGNLRIERGEIVEDNGEDWDIGDVITEIEYGDGGDISDLYEPNENSITQKETDSSNEETEIPETNIKTKTYANNGQRRTDTELQTLKNMVHDGKSIEEMANILQRKPSAIIGKLPGPSISNDLLVSILNCDEINSLSFQTLNELDENQAKMLGTFRGASMYFSILDHLDKGVTAQLCKFKGSRLYLNGIKHLSKSDATNLSKFGGEILSLQGLQTIEEGGAEILKEFSGTLMLPNAINFVKKGEKDDSNKNTKIDISKIIPFIAPELKEKRKEKVKTLSSDNKIIYFKIRNILLKANFEMGKRVDCNIPIIIEKKPQTKKALMDDLCISEEEFEQCGNKILEFIKNNL